MIFFSFLLSNNIINEEEYYILYTLKLIKYINFEA